MKLGMINGWDEASIKNVSDFGLWGVEFCINHNYDSSEVLAKEPEIRRNLEKYDVHCGSIGRWGETRVDDDGKVVAAALQHDHNIIDLAAALSCPVVNVGMNRAKNIPMLDNYKVAAEYFAGLLDYAKARGVNIVPEFDAPAHALALTRVRPELMLRTDDPRSIEELDASKPETLEFIQRLWDEYLLPGKEKGQRAVFEGCTVHIGADEFKGDSEDYRRFTDAMLKHIKARGYTPRLWGSLTMKKGSTPVTAEGVQMNIWSKDWNLPRPAINEGYDIINTMDSQLYIVPFANYYRMDKNLKGLYENFVPNQIGAQGRPLAERLPAGHPQLLGAAFAVWNDMIDLRSNGYTYEDLRGMIAETAAAFAQKAWGPEELPRSFEDHQKLRQTIGDATHGVSVKPNPKKH